MKIQNLQKGDLIALAAASRKVNKADYTDFANYLMKQGYKVMFADNLACEDNQFAGSDEERIAAINNLFENKQVKAIFFIRGGYGAVRIIDKLNWAAFTDNPKWLCGYSDTCVLLNHAYSICNIPTLHCDMPVHFSDTNYDHKNFSLAINLLEQGKLEYEFPIHPLSNPQNVEGKIIGGNLSILYSLLGSNSIPDTQNAILFIEDLDEYLYHIDRMIMGLKRSGIFNNIKALIVGGMTDMHDNAIPFGKTAEEIINSNFPERKFPIFFDFPAGHALKNYPLIIGEKAELKILNDKIIFSQNIF